MAGHNPNQTACSISDPTFSKLFLACENGELPLVKTLYSEAIDNHGASYRERTQPALNIAASNKHAAICSYLLDRGLVIDQVVVKAALHGASTEVLQVLFDHGWDINWRLGLAGPVSLLTRRFVFISEYSQTITYLSQALNGSY